MQTCLEESPKKKRRLFRSPWIRATAALLALILFLGVGWNLLTGITLKRSGQGDLQDAAAGYLLDHTAYTSEGAWQRAQTALLAGTKAPETYGDYEVLASTYLAKEEYDKALPNLVKCIDLYDGSDAGRAELWMKRACLEALMGSYSDAQASLSAMFDLGYSAPEAYLLRGQIYYQQGQLVLVEKDFAVYVDERPEDLQMCAALGEIAYANTHYVRAIQCYSTVLEHPESDYYSSGMLLRRAACYLQSQSDELGVADCTAYLSLEGTGDGSALFLRGAQSAALGVDKFALADFVSAAEAGYSRESICYEQAAGCAYRLGLYDACLTYGEKAFSVMGGITQPAPLYELMGLSCLSNQSASDAIRWFDLALDAEPGFTEVAYFRGVAQMSGGDFEKAVTDFTAAIDGGINVQACYYNRGVCYVSLKQTQAGLDDLTLAAQGEDADIASQAQELLGLLKQG